MAKFLRTEDMLVELRDMLEGAKERIVLVSPYLQVGPRIQTLLSACSARGLSIDVVYREKEQRWKGGSKESRNFDWLKLPMLRVKLLTNLHSKCYLSESHAIITSMNLYDYSQTNSVEMGVLLDREVDKELYTAVETEVNRLLSAPAPKGNGGATMATEGLVTPTPPLSMSKETAVGTVLRKFAALFFAPSETAIASGFCIRCGEAIPLDVVKPLCKSDYGKWKAYENRSYQEKFCHRCGSKHATSMNKPLCHDCFNSSK